jgi:hypothetical protein
MNIRGKSPSTSSGTKSVLDRLSWLVQAIGESPRLCQWLCDLERKSIAERRNEILLTTAQMSGQKEDVRLITSFGLLADHAVFNAVLLALRETGKMKAGLRAAVS